VIRGKTRSCRDADHWQFLRWKENGLVIWAAPEFGGTEIAVQKWQRAEQSRSPQQHLSA